MYIIVNDNNLYLMQIDFNDYSFTTKKELATKFMTEEGTNSKIRRLSMFKPLSFRWLLSVPQTDTGSRGEYP